MPVSLLGNHIENVDAAVSGFGYHEFHVLAFMVLLCCVIRSASFGGDSVYQSILALQALQKLSSDNNRWNSNHKVDGRNPVNYSYGILLFEANIGCNPVNFGRPSEEAITLKMWIQPCRVLESASFGGDSVYQSILALQAPQELSSDNNRWNNNHKVDGRNPVNYSYEILLFEAITGRNPVNFGRPPEELFVHDNTTTTRKRLQKLDSFPTNKDQPAMHYGGTTLSVATIVADSVAIARSGILVVNSTVVEEAPVNDDEEDDSLVEEVSPVKSKKSSRCAAKAKKNDPKEPPKELTMKEKNALCQA
nr:hypothetical protein [Tanacetum cinerariifolium]